MMYRVRPHFHKKTRIVFMNTSIGSPIYLLGMRLDLSISSRADYTFDESPAAPSV